ncbi:RNA 2'-phosphotransferase [Parenemella sanctibonifatiensis]|uniref:RNA 2'-phosphotransferase n=1 Tax=Parenemella sanctibonifatiensis TaxID=2016505 RepID=UPI002B4C06B7|nr:RNA 2'-phosphotransferase [Parenemella sanctibonifatiensis]
MARQAEEPPPVLHHGTAPTTWPLIKREGLRPMARQLVHLSVDRATAELVGRRKAPHPVLLEVAAGRAYADGIAFYRGNDTTWLADHVPPHYLRRQN